jgi:hypothetical protein
MFLALNKIGKIHFLEEFFVFLRFGDNIMELSVAQDFSHKFNVTLFESKLEHLIIIFEYVI